MSDFDEKDLLKPFKDEKTQKELNKPLNDPSGINLEDQEYMLKVLDMVDKGKIDLYSTSSLINADVLKNLIGEKQAEMELKAATLLASIREIKDLYGAGFGTSYQIQNLVHRLKENVEFIEEAGGDVFII